jgi:hypothetical protein
LLKYKRFTRQYLKAYFRATNASWWVNKQNAVPLNSIHK